MKEVRKMVRVQGDTWARVKALAALKGKNIYEVLEDALQAYLEETTRERPEGRSTIH